MFSAAAAAFPGPMKLHAIDAAIILIYFLFAIGAGIWVARRGAKT